MSKIPSGCEVGPRGDDMAAACRGRLLRREARVLAMVEGWTSRSPRYRPSQAVLRVSASLSPGGRDRMKALCYCQVLLSMSLSGRRSPVS